MSDEDSQLLFQISPNVLKTQKPPIPQIVRLGFTYPETPERPLIDMSQGVPGIPPPPLLLDTLGKYAADTGSCRYTYTPGEDTFRHAFAEEMKATYGNDIDIKLEDVAFTAGCNMAFVACMITLADAGDEVILPTPWYFNNQMTLDMLGIKTVGLPTKASDGFAPSVDICRPLITSKTKAICFVTPNNPTGAIYPISVIHAFAALAKEHNIALVLDETYRGSIAGTLPHNLFKVTPEWNWRSNIVHLFSFSKSYSIPGHRLGAVIASPEMIGHLCTVMDSLLICAPRAIQLALCDTLVGLRPFIKENAVELRHRHAKFKEYLPPQWSIGSQGGYFAFTRHPFKNVTALEIAKTLAAKIGVLCLPAEFFFSPEDANGENAKWVRFSVVNVGEEKIKAVCDRLLEVTVNNPFGWELE